MSWRDHSPTSRQCPPLIVWLAEKQREIQATAEEKAKKKLKREAGRNIAQVARTLSLNGCASRANNGNG